MSLKTDLIHVFASDPLVTSDSANGFHVGEEWENSSSRDLFECIDDSVGAAVWINKTATLSGGYVTINGPVEIGDDAVLAPAQITANQNDYNPAGWITTGEVQVSFLVLDADGNYNLTGLEAPSPAKRMRVTIFNNSATQNLTFVNNSGSSLAANRFLSNGNVTLNEKEAIDFIYSPLESRWIPVTK